MFYQIDNLKNYKAEVFLSEEGLALDTSAFQSFYREKMTLLIPLIKSFVFVSPAIAAKRFIFPSRVYLQWRELVVREHEITSPRL